jgi:hypothetical protein
MPSALENLARIGKLTAEPPSQVETAGLVKSAKSRLRDAQNLQNSVESRFDLAYGAAHALALAALRHHGYRSEHRYIVFQCLEHSLQVPAAKWRVLNDAHRKRNIAEYEGSWDIDDRLLEALIRVTLELEGLVDRLVAAHPVSR